MLTNGLTPSFTRRAASFAAGLRTMILSLLLAGGLLTASAQGPDRCMFGDTILHMDFGQGSGVFGSFAAAGLSSLNSISSVYRSYDLSTTTAFYGGDYCITDNTHPLRMMTGLKHYKSGKSANNAYLVDTLRDHTHMVDPSVTDGRYLLVNGDVNPGVVFKRRITELCSNAEFEFGAWTAYAHGNNLKNTKLQFELWADDPGDAIPTSSDVNAAFDWTVPSDGRGAMIPVYASLAAKDAGTVTTAKLLYKSAAFEPRTTKDLRNRTVDITVDAETDENGYAIYSLSGVAAANSYFYQNADGLWCQTVQSTTTKNKAGAYVYTKEGSRVYSSSEYTQPVYALSTSGDTAWIYTDDSDNSIYAYYDRSAGAWYDLELNDACTELARTTNPVVDETIYRRMTWTTANGYQVLSDGHGSFAYYDGAAYKRITASFTLGTTNRTLGSADLAVNATALLDYDAMTPTRYTYLSTANEEYEVVSSRWTQFLDHFKLKDVSSVYLVLRNAIGNNTDNDFCVDDITFRPYSAFNLLINLSTSSIDQVCETGMVTLISDFVASENPEDASDVEAHIANYGFQFQGYDPDFEEWVPLGGDIPLQIQRINDRLELTLPLDEYNLYSRFRLSVAATPEGFGGKCITFATPDVARNVITQAPSFKIIGKDVCDDGGVDRTGRFYIVRTNSEAPTQDDPWRVAVTMPDGTTKILESAACGKVSSYTQGADGAISHTTRNEQ